MIILKKKSLNLDEKNIEVKIFQFDTWLIYLVDLILEIIRDKKKSYHTLPEALSSIHPTTLYQKLSAQYILPHFTRSSQLNTFKAKKPHIKWKILCAFLIYDISEFGPLNYLEPFRNNITNKFYGPSIPLRRSFC